MIPKPNRELKSNHYRGKIKNILGGPAKATTVYSIYGYIQSFQNLNFGRGTAILFVNWWLVLIGALIINPNWKVFSITGKKMIEGKGNIIDISSHAKGIYILKINTSFIKLLN